MPIPLILAAPAIGASVIAIGGAWYYANEAGDNWKETTVEEAQNLVNQGYQFLGDIGEDIGEGLEAIGAGIAGLAGSAGNSLLDFIRGLGIAVLQGASDTVNYIIAETKEFRVPVAQTITSLLIWFGAAMVVYRMIMKLN